MPIRIFRLSIDIRYIGEDADFVAYSSINKVLVFNTANINPKTTRNSQGSRS